MLNTLQKIIFMGFIVMILPGIRASNDSGMITVETSDKSYLSPACSLPDGWGGYASINPEVPIQIDDTPLLYTINQSDPCCYFKSYAGTFLNPGPYYMVVIGASQKQIITNYTLNLYSDNNFSNYIGNGTYSEKSLTKWVVFRGGSYTYSGEWVYTRVNSSNSQTSKVCTYDFAAREILDNVVELDPYKPVFLTSAFLSAGKSYTIQLDKAKYFDTDFYSNDFDLYVLRHSEKNSSYFFFFYSSITEGNGIHENVTFTPSESDYFAIVIAMGCRTCSVHISLIILDNSIPGFKLFLIIGCFIMILFIMRGKKIKWFRHHIKNQV
ncbi:MAG: hypothetical protein ACTSQ8_19025 [Candidatus Helarchaeota archaeon]